MKFSKEIAKHMGERLRFYRTKNGLTQKELAEMFRVSNVQMCNIEAGKRKLNYERLQKFCIRFNLKSTDILPF